MSCSAGQQRQQQQCSVNNLLAFESSRFRDRPRTDRFQAIVPAYTFQCTGRVTEWRACVSPGISTRQQYYIQFQVWRPTANGIKGCYELVDDNIPLDDARKEEMSVSDSTSIIDLEAEGFLSPPGGIGDPLSYCVVLPVRESQQIEVQPGDVVGYYVDRFRHGDDRSDGGIQWIDSTEVKVYYRDDIRREDIKSQYAININPTSCGFQVSSTRNSHYLSQSAASAPIISLNFSESNALTINTHSLSDLYLFACAATVMLTSTVAPMVTLNSSTTIIQPEMSPSVPPPATPPSVSQDGNTASIVGIVLASTEAPPGPVETSTFTLTTTSVTLSSSMTSQPEISPPVPPPATPPSVSQDGNTASIVGIVLASTEAPPGPVETSTFTLTTTSVTLSSSMTSQPEISPPVPPPTTPQCGSQDDNIIIVGSVLVITAAAIGKLFYSPFPRVRTHTICI